MVSFHKNSVFLINNHTSVKDASTHSGYSMQYIRRLLRLDSIAGLKIGQVWLVEIDSLNAYLTHALNSKDQRFSPK
jgi:hypothetical protein